MRDDLPQDLTGQQDCARHQDAHYADVIRRSRQAALRVADDLAYKPSLLERIGLLLTIATTLVVVLALAAGGPTQ